MRGKLVILSLAVAFVAMACNTNKNREKVKGSDAEKTIGEGWVYLFDGKSMDGWWIQQRLFRMRVGLLKMVL